MIIPLEAEAGELSGSINVIADDTAFQGGYIVSDSANSGAVRYNVNIPSTGEYVIWCRVWAGTGPDRGNHDSVFVRVNGIEDVYDVAEGKWADKWQWTAINGRAGSSPATLNPRIFELTQGEQVIEIRGREAGTIIDSIIITNDRNFVPTE